MKNIKRITILIISLILIYICYMYIWNSIYKYKQSTEFFYDKEKCIEERERESLNNINCINKIPQDLSWVRAIDEIDKCYHYLDNNPVSPKCIQYNKRSDTISYICGKITYKKFPNFGNNTDDRKKMTKEIEECEIKLIYETWSANNLLEKYVNDWSTHSPCSWPYECWSQETCNQFIWICEKLDNWEKIFNQTEIDNIVKDNILIEQWCAHSWICYIKSLSWDIFNYKNNIRIDDILSKYNKKINWPMWIE